MTRHWITADAMIDGTGGPASTNVAIGIEADRIVALTPVTDLGPGDIVHRFPDATIVPGLIDAHVHLLFTGDVDHGRTRNTFETADDATLTAIGVRNAAETLLGGVTTVRDCGDTRGIVAAIRDVGRDGWLVGPRILTAGAPLTTPRGHLNWCGNTVSNDTEIVAAVHRLADDGADLLKIMASGGNMTVESDPLSAQFTDHELALAVRTAHDRGLLVAAHAQNVHSITGCVRAGVDTIEHCLWRDETGRPADPATLVEVLRGSSSTVMLTLAGIQRALLPGALHPGSSRAAAAEVSPTGGLATDFAWARQVADAGVPVAVASDAGVRFTPFRGFLDTVACAMEALQCSVEQAIASVTSRAADAIGIGDEVGRIAPGMVADLTVVQGFPGSQGVVSNVIKDGRVVVRDRALTPPPRP